MAQATRSWTDATTNNIAFRGLNASSYLPWLLDRTFNQNHLLGTFLHEFTHHWCYNSALGTASALIEMRLTLLTEAHPEARSIWAREYAAHEMIRNLLRPMSEGLSQLAEFDLTHVDDDPREGTPLGAAVLCFGLSEDNLSRHMMIQGLRHSSEQLDRKASLYLKPFEVKDGYLPGYMAVKNIAWSIVGRGYNVPIEALLAYLRSYFWDDPVLVNILFSEEMNGGYVAEHLHERFTQRIYALLTVADLPERIQAFWQDWTPQVDFNRANTLYCTPEEFGEAAGRLTAVSERLFELIVSEGAKLERQLGLAPHTLKTLLQDLSDCRRYIMIAESSIEIDKQGEFRVTAGVEPHQRLQNPNIFKELAPGSYTVSIVMPTFGAFVGVLAQARLAEPSSIRLHAAEKSPVCNGLVSLFFIITI